MSTTIMIQRNFDYAAIAAETADYWVEITPAQALAFAKLVEASGQTAYYYDEPAAYSTHVPSVGANLLDGDATKAIFDQPLAHQLIDQARRLDIKLYVTEALGLGPGRYLLSRVIEAANDVSLYMAGGNFSALWSALGLQPNHDEDTVGELNLDIVDKAINDNEADPVVACYAARLRDVIAYGRQVGAQTLYWA